MIRLTLDCQYDRMPWDKIDAVVFDVGQVLLRFDPRALLQRIVPERPDLHEQLRARVFLSPYWVMMDRGSITQQEVAEAMTTHVPEEIKPYIRRILAHWNELEEIPEGLRVLHACKARGKKVYVLSNYSREPFAHTYAAHDFFRLFDGVFISSHHQLLKPEHAIYAKAAEHFGLIPHRTLFIDDVAANIEGALNAGWHGLCYNHPGKLDAFFAE